MSLETNQIIASQLRPLLTRLTRKLRKLSPADTELSHTERSVLVLLDQHGELLSGELAAIEKITPQSMGQLLNHLTALDLVTKTVSLTDKRKVIIGLSKTGKMMIERVRNERNEWLATAISQACTPEDQKVLLAAIGPLTKLVDFN